MTSDHQVSGLTSQVSPQPQTPFEAEVISLFVDWVQVFGLPKSYGEIYGLLYASSASLSFAEIQAKLGRSSGAISQGLRALKELGAIRVADEARELSDVGGQKKSDKAETRNLKPESNGNSVKQGSASPFKTSGKTPAHYAPEVELKKLVKALLAERLKPQLESGSRRLHNLPSLIPDSDHQEVLSGRVAKLNKWRKRAGMLLPVVNRVLV